MEGTEGIKSILITPSPASSPIEGGENIENFCGRGNCLVIPMHSIEELVY
jgi:hypothetical protein